MPAATDKRRLATVMATKYRMWCGESNQNKMLYSTETLQLLSSLYQRKTGTDTKIYVDVFVNNADVTSSNIADRQHVTQVADCQGCRDINHLIDITD